jgi:hypothetical protein
LTQQSATIELKKKISISLYWKCQFIGWSVAALYWGYLGYIGKNYNFLIGLLEFISDIAVYIFITHLYRNFALRNHWQQLNLNQLLKRIIPTIVVMGSVYLLVTVIKVYLFDMWLNPCCIEPFTAFFKHNCAAIFVAGIRLMSIWLLAYHMYHYAQREISIGKENARLELITRDAQLNNLSAQLNPHFLFNSLNNIKALVIENPKSARRAIDLLSDILRTALYGRDVQLISLNDELGLAKDYLELEKLRFEERLQFSIETDGITGNAMIPRFCIQTLVENAIKHGVDQQKNGGLIRIGVAQLSDGIRINVQNPGKLSIDAGREGLGLKNLKERLQLQYKGKAQFDINNADGIVSATIIIPAP